MRWYVLLYGLLCCCARDQYLFFIDTDAALPSQLRDNRSGMRAMLAADAAIDTVRIDILDLDGALHDTCQFFVPEEKDWPLSLGLQPSLEGKTVRLRVRGFRGRYSRPDSTAIIPQHCAAEQRASMITTLTEPLPELAIDRLVELPPATSVTQTGVRLSLGCMGIPPSFLDGTTCVTEPAAMQPATQTDEVAASQSRAGSSSLAQLYPCDEALRPRLTKMEAVCIPGGLTVQGEPRAVGLSSPELDSVPLRVVFSSPFYMDKTEFTIERLLALRLADPMLPLPFANNDPSSRVIFSEFCTWQSGADTDRLPINCMEPEQAATLCAAAHPGGQLPSEAQWERAAHGSAEHRTYPFGDTEASCCTASLSRMGPPGTPTECGGTGVEPVASHTGAGCPGGGDVSAEGVIDLGGSLNEYTRDSLRSYRVRCGLPRVGIAVDPVCPLDDGARVAKGSYWNAGRETAWSGRRTYAALGSIDGFRCIYPGVRQ